MAYSKINWENEPSILTPINETNLNHMDAGIYNLDQNKMDASNPVGTGSLSMNRFPGSPVGTDSSTLGGMNAATGYYSHAEGFMNKALNSTAHAEGSDTKASGIDSHSQNSHTIAAGYSQTAMGRYNIEDHGDIYALIIGNGTDDDNRANMFTQDWDGNVKVSGEIEDGNGIKLSDILPTDTESGNPCVITDAFGGKAKSLSLDIEPIQSGSGTPSPDNVRPISGISSGTVTRTGKNLFDGSQTITYIYGDLSGKYVYSANGSYIVPIKGGETYTVSTPNAQTIFTSTSADYPAVGVDIVDAYTGSGGLAVTKKTIATSPSANYLVFHFGGVPNYNNVQVELGSTNTPYEPYNGQTITRTYGQTIGAGSDDVTGSGVTQTWAFVELDGSEDENWQMFGSGSASGYAMVCKNYTDILPQVTESDIISNYLPTIASIATWGNYDNFISSGMTNPGITIGMRTITTVADMRTYLSNHPLQVAYKLTTPTTISLASQNIDLLHGDNVLTSNAKTVNVSYKADVQLYIDKKLSE